MSNVYSTLLVSIHDGGTLDFDVPAGRVMVIRCVTVFNSAAVEGPTPVASVSIQPDDVTIWQRAVGVQTAFQDLMHVVLTVGQKVQGSADGGVDLSVSGFLLTLP